MFITHAHSLYMPLLPPRLPFFLIQRPADPFCSSSVRHCVSAAHFVIDAFIYLSVSNLVLFVSEPCSVTLRVEAKAQGPARKESAKVRNRRFRRKFNGSPTKPRLSVFCSNKQLYAMLVDDQNKKTLFYASTLQKSIRGDPECTLAEAAQRVGEELIKACKELNISEISSYDRNGFARGERMQAFEIPISQHGFLWR